MQIKNMLALLCDALGVKIEGPHIADKYLLDNVVASGANFGMTGVRNFAPDRWLNEGDQLKIGDLVFDVYHTPGHSPGGITLWCEAEGVALVGDSLFAGSVGRTDFPGSDPRTLERSIRTKLYTLPPETKVYPGHGPTTTIGAEMASNPYVSA